MTSTLIRDSEALRPLPPEPTDRARRSPAVPAEGEAARATRWTPTSSQHERLGKPTALAVFASDALSSTAYATEEILRTLVPVVGVLAFSLVLPITLAMVGRARDPDVQLPPDDQGLPVGRRRLHRHQGQPRAAARPGRRASRCSPTTSSPSPCRCRPASPRSTRPSATLRPYRVPIALGFIVDHRLGQPARREGVGPDLRRAHLRLPRPIFVMIASGVVQGRRPAASHARPRGGSRVPIERRRAAASMFLLLHAFASGGAAMTGVEAISNGVPAFKTPEWKNARSR